jgi:hypothetical protein
VRLLPCLLLSGCSVIYVPPPAGPQQVEAPTILQPACVFWCQNTRTITSQQGARIEGAEGAVTIDKGVQTTTTESTAPSITTQEAIK